MSDAREKAVERLAALLCGLAEDGDEVATPRTVGYHEGVGDQLLGRDGGEHLRHARWLTFAKEACDSLNLIAIDPTLVEAVERARADLANAHADHEAIRLQREDCEAFGRLRAACAKVGGDADPWKAWRWLVPTAAGDLAKAERALADAVLAQLRGGR
jgi:hypothetical protein